MGQYSKLASEAGRHLFIAAFESTGAFGKGVNEVLKACSALVSYESFNESADDRTWASATFQLYWAQRLAVSFWRGSFQMQLATSAAARSAAAHNLSQMDGEALEELGLRAARPTSGLFHYQAPALRDARSVLTSVPVSIPAEWDATRALQTAATSHPDGPAAPVPARAGPVARAAPAPRARGATRS